MTQKNKDLLLKDLCARQIYNVKCKVFDDTNSYTLSGVLHNKPYSQLYFLELDWKEFDGFVDVKYCKPYLFPLSSMTDEQAEELFNLFGLECPSTEEDYIKINEVTGITFFLNNGFDVETHLDKLTDWLNKHHLDYRGLIPKGLALDATELNIY